MWYFYVLQSQKDKDWFYKGSTGNLNKRLDQHNNGEVISSQFYRPLKLVYYEAYVSETAVRERESAVKKSGSVSTPLMKRIKDSLKYPRRYRPTWLANKKASERPECLGNA